MKFNRLVLTAVVFLAIIDIAVLGLLFNRSLAVAAANTSEPAGSTKSDAPGTAASPKADDGHFQKLMGRWVRPDGGYVIDIKDIENNGRLNAAYYNPSSINVARAEASAEGSVVRVFIELRDVNYPGATYRLTYQTSEDLLTGEYYQPKLGQTFNVRFIRASRPGPM